jgi:CRP/FNR family transcriptional regulator, cyclic AMP receptor protein
MTEQGAELAGSGIFADLSGAERELVSAAACPVRFGAGERLFREGTPAHGCWLIHDGCVALDLMVPGRGQVVVQTLGRGDVLGWSWLLPPYQWHFGAVALRPTTATQLDTDLLRTLAEQDPRFGYALTLSLFQACVQRLQATRARLLDLYRSPDDQS